MIGLALCPFAKAAQVGNRIRYRVSEARSAIVLLDELADELELLQRSDPEQIETTLLIHPYVLTDFLEYNDFLNDADAAIEALNLSGEVQVASFHPQYQFAETAADAIENYTNRSPYPMLHLLREASIARAVDEFPGIESVPDKNIETMRKLGQEGWRRLWMSES